MPPEAKIPDQKQNPENHEQQPLAGTLAIVTGFYRDIGGAITEELALRGAAVFGVHRDPGKAFRRVPRAINEFQALGIGGQIDFITADITNPDDREQMKRSFLRTYGGQPQLDSLILNASGPTTDLNVVANDALVTQYLPFMPPGGKIILMQSVPGHYYDELNEEQQAVSV